MRCSLQRNYHFIPGFIPLSFILDVVCCLGTTCWLKVDVVHMVVDLFEKLAYLVASRVAVAETYDLSCV